MKHFKTLQFSMMMLLFFVAQPQVCASEKELVQDAFKFLVGIGEEVSKDAVRFFSADQATQKGYSLRDVISGAASIHLVPEPFLKFLDGITFLSPRYTKTAHSVELIWDDVLVFGKRYKLPVRAYYGPGKGGSKPGFSFSVGFPGINTIGSLLPATITTLKEKSLAILPEGVKKLVKEGKVSLDDFVKIVDWLEFENIGYVLSLSSFDDPLWGKLSFGLNIKATMRLAGPLLNFAQYLGKDLTTAQASGLVTLKGGGTEVRAIYPGRWTFLRWPLDPKKEPFFHVRTGAIEARVGLATSSSWIKPIPSIKLIQGIEVKLPFQDDYLTFRSSGDLFVTTEGMVGFELAAWMDGLVKNMFGIPGLDVGDLGLGMTLSYLPPAEIVPSAVFLRGESHVGTLKARYLASFDLAKQQVGGYTKLAAMTQFDCADWLTQVAQGLNDLKLAKIDTTIFKTYLYKNLPPFTMKDIELSFFAKASSIFEQKYSKGLTLKGGIEIFGVGGEVAFEWDKYTIRGLAWLKEMRIPVNNPVIIIAGAGADKRRGTPDDGPILDIELALLKLKAEMFMDGVLKIPALHVDMDTRFFVGLKGIECDIKHQLAGYDADIHMSGDTLKPESFILKGAISQSGLSALGAALQKDARAFSDRANKDLTAAKANVLLWQQQAEKDIDAWISSQVAQTEKAMGALRSSIERAKTRCGKATWLNWSIECAEMLLVPEYTIALGVAQVHKEVTLKGVARQIAKSGVKLASANAQLGLSVAQGAVEVARATTDFMGKVLAGGLNITSVTFHGGLKELVDQGALPRVEVAGVILGKQFKQVYQLNVKNPGQLSAQIVAGVVQVFGPQPQPYKAPIQQYF